MPISPIIRSVAIAVQALSLCMFATPAFAQISVERAVSAALSRPYLGALKTAAQAREIAKGKRLGLWKNPEITSWREQVLETEEEDSEDLIGLRQEIMLSGKTSLLTQAAEHKARAAGLVVEAERRRVAAKTRLRFWAVVYAHRQHARAVEWQARLKRAVEVIDRRLASGDASTLDAKRLRLEMASAQRNLGEAALTRQTAWRLLEEMTGNLGAGNTWPRTAGRLLPAREEAIALSMIDQRVDVEAWRVQREAAKLELAAAELGWVPKLELSAGYKTVQRGDLRTHGYAAGVTLSVPLFDRGQADIDAAKQERAYANAMATKLADEATRERNAWSDQATGHIHLAATSREVHQRAIEGLAEVAELALQSGEITLSEWLTLHRRALDESRHVVALEWRARGAVEALRAAVMEASP